MAMTAPITIDNSEGATAMTMHPTTPHTTEGDNPLSEVPGMV